MQLDRRKLQMQIILTYCADVCIYSLRKGDAEPILPPETTFPSQNMQTRFLKREIICIHVKTAVPSMQTFHTL